MPESTHQPAGVTLPPEEVAFIGELRKAARAVYLATDADVADDLSKLLSKAAEGLENLPVVTNRIAELNRAEAAIQVLTTLAEQITVADTGLDVKLRDVPDFIAAIRDIAAEQEKAYAGPPIRPRPEEGA